MTFRPAIRLIAALALAHAGCKSEEPQIAGTSGARSAKPCEGAALTESVKPTVAPERRRRVPAGEVISFTQHVEPMLSSQADGFVYKCTVCHTNYSRAAEVQKALDTILDSIRAKRMPTGGDPVRDFDVELLERWRSEGKFALDGPKATNVLPIDGGQASTSTATATGTESAETDATPAEKPASTRPTSSADAKESSTPCKESP